MVRSLLHSSRNTPVFAVISKRAPARLSKTIAPGPVAEIVPPCQLNVPPLAQCRPLCRYFVAPPLIVPTQLGRSSVVPLPSITPLVQSKLPTTLKSPGPVIAPPLRIRLVIVPALISDSVAPLTVTLP